MILRLKVVFHRKERETLDVEIENAPNLEWHQMLDYIDQHKVEILKQVGCNLTDQEIKSELANGDAIVMINYGK